MQWRATTILSWGVWAICCLPAMSQTISDVRIVGQTNTQVLIGYTAPDGDQMCSVILSENPSLSPLVHDVNPALFPGANLDSREGSIRNGKQRVFVAGQRRGDQAVDGKIYSRALQTDTQHYYQIQCGAATASGTVTTETIPGGLTHTELPPFNSAGNGNFGWPSIDWTDQTKAYTDPMTGLHMRRFAASGVWGSQEYTPFVYHWDATGAWTNPGSIVSDGTSSLASTGTAAAPIFAGNEPTFFKVAQQGGFDVFENVDDIAVRIYGSGTGVDAQSRTVEVCLTIDSGATCYTEPIDVTLPQGTSANVGLVPAVFPKPMFGGWNKAVPREHFPTLGKITVSAGVVTLVKNQWGGPPDTNSWFGLNWAPGTKLWIEGSSPTCPGNLCTIADVKHAAELTLSETELTLPETNFKAANFGARITKKNATGTVSVSARMHIAWSYGWIMPASGATDQCARTPVQTSVAADGTPLGSPLSGHLCIFPNSRGGLGGLFFLGTNGETRFVSAVRTPASIPGHAAQDQPSPLVGHAGPTQSTFSLTEANVFYATVLTNSGKRSVFRLTYRGDYSELRYNYPQGGGGQQPLTPSDNITWENITKSSENKDIQSQITARFPNYDVSRYGSFDNVTGRGISGKYMVFTKNTPSGFQDSPCWTFLLNIETGVLDVGFNSWDGQFHPYLRWAGCHSIDATSMPNHIFVAAPLMNLNIAAATHGGPYTVPLTKVRKGGTFLNDTSFSWPISNAYDNACPVDIDQKYKDMGAVGTKCVTVRIKGEPCNAVPTAEEKAWAPCTWDANRAMLQSIDPGDLIVEYGKPANSERMRVVKRTDPGGGEIELVLQRDIGIGKCSMAAQINPAQATHPNGWSLMMVTGDPGLCDGGVFIVNALTAETRSEHPHISSGHFDIGVAPDDGKFTVVGASLSDLDGSITYAVRFNKGPENIGQLHDFDVAAAPSFSNIPDTNAFIQGYASLRQWTAQREDRRWTLDFRHMNGNVGSSPESIYNTLFTTTTALQSGTNKVYKLSVFGNKSYKRLPILVTAGRYLFLEKSGPEIGNTLTDVDEYRFCYAYKAGECRSGSAAGDLFAVVPKASLTGYCNAGQRARNIPCAFSGPGVRGWVTQSDISTPNGLVRRLTMAWNGPGQHYPYANARSTPDGKWAVVNGFWVGGLRGSDLLLFKLPKFTKLSSEHNDQFVRVVVDAPQVEGATHAVVEFGYRENGPAENLYCTARSETCVAGLGNETTPYYFASETFAAMSCSAGCAIPVPAYAGRMLYYRVRHLDAGGNTRRLGPTEVRAIF
jgi:hypothetical protein